MTKKKRAEAVRYLNAAVVTETFGKTTCSRLL